MKTELETVTPPAYFPVTIEECKLYCNVDDDFEDQNFNAWLAAATEAWETDNGRQLITTSYRLFLDSATVNKAISIDKPPLQEVTAVKYVDTNLDVQTIDPADYEIIRYFEFASILFKTLPQDMATDRRDVLRIEFDAGHGAAEDIPQRAKVWILGQVAQWYRNREHTSDKPQFDAGYANLLKQNRSWRLGRQ